MSVVGIVAEFNPLHRGHEYLISEAKKLGTVVVAMSGNFVQRGDTAIAEKRIRTEAALKCGADLVVELPVLWSMSTAENFALGAVSILKNMGCDKIMFGSESGDIEALIKAADILLSDNFSEKLAAELKRGVTFATAREAAAKGLGLKGDILSKPNNNLAIEYIKASRKIGAELEFLTVKRIGADHDSSEEAEFASASLLREKLRLGDYAFCSKYMSERALELFIPETVSDISRIDRAVLSVLRTKTLDELEMLPDVSEGIENKLFSSIRLAESIDDLYNRLKVKRYTLARIRRLVFWGFIGADNSFFMKRPPYIRVLGFNKCGEAQLKAGAKNSKVPVVIRVADIKQLDSGAQRVFETECRATDLFGLTLKKPLECGLEYISKIIKTE